MEGIGNRPAIHLPQQGRKLIHRLWVYLYIIMKSDLMDMPVAEESFAIPCLIDWGFFMPYPVW
jgi:hypothetical protein